MQRAKQEPGLPDIENRFEDFFDLHDAVGAAIAFHRAVYDLRSPGDALAAHDGVFVEAAGRKFGYSADTAYDPRLIEWLSRADLIVHEANGGYPHTPYERLAELPIDLRKKMLVVHCADGFDPPGREVELLRRSELLGVKAGYRWTTTNAPPTSGGMRTGLPVVRSTKAQFVSAVANNAPSPLRLIR